MPLPTVLFEDDALIAFDKPSGMLIVPDQRDRAKENLVGLVQAKMGKGEIGRAHV